MDNLEDKNITPAFSNTYIADNGQLSPQEFQKTLYNWFNKKGLISEMRSYLRMKMIEALKKTTIGESLNNHTNNTSIENQALNILIADYLFQHEYDYSLSVFSTEVPIKTLVSEFCFFVINKERSKVRHKIQEDNVMSILESIGISANSEMSREIFTSYNQIEKGSLLLCILKIVMNYYRIEEKPSNSDDHIEEIGKVVRRIMLHFDIPMSAMNHLIEKINFIVKNHVNSMSTKLSKEFQDEKLVLQTEYSNKELEFKQKLIDIDKFLNEETNRIEKEHRKLVYLTENMVSNEKKLSEKSNEMEAKLKRINELEFRLNEELEKCAKIKNGSTSVKVQHVCTLKHCDEECEKMRLLLDELKIQKNSFQKIAENQNILIANLTAKSNIMYKQLQEGMYTIEDLRSQLARQKELLEREKRKRELTSEKTLSSSDALTVGTDGEGDHADEFIKQTHIKLNALEKESVEIEHKFKEFQLTLRNT